jgi:hypothetical protein
MSQKASAFFFEKKNQKTFIPSRPTPSLRAKRSHPVPMPPPAYAEQHTGSPILTPSLPTSIHKSLFASFSSEKEESF